MNENFYDSTIRNYRVLETGKTADITPSEFVYKKVYYLIYFSLLCCAFE